MKLLVVSICRDEAPTIGQVLDEVPASIPGIKKIEKWVVDDGSQDQTVEVARAHGAEVISDGQHKRLAFRFREAVELALARQADIMVNVDGDGQFDPKEIPSLVEPIVAHRADFVAADRFSHPQTGKRRRPKNMSRGKYWGNMAGAWVVGRLSNYQFKDVTCGFRAYSRAALFALNTDGSFTYTQESFQVLAMKRLRIHAVPVGVQYFPDRHSRVVTKSIWSYIGTSAVSILRSYRDFAPLKFFGWLGFIPFIIGLIFLAIVLRHWVDSGSITPLKYLGLSGLYLISLGIMFWAMGLAADMLSRVLNNQEKILERLKKIQYEEKSK